MKVHYFVLIVSVAACGSSDSTPSGADCDERCGQKVTLCGAPNGAQLCRDQCALSPTESQLRCLEAADCTRLREGAEACGDIDVGDVDAEVRRDIDASLVSGCDANQAPQCDGTVLVTCRVVGQAATTVRETCLNGCQDGMCNGEPSLPDSVTITGRFGEAEVIAVNGEDGPIGLLTVSAIPQITQELPSLPNLFGRSGTVVLPTLPVGCAPQVSSTLNRGQVSLSLQGGGTCILWLDRVTNDGVEIAYEDVPYQTDNGVTIDVTVRLHP